MAIEPANPAQRPLPSLPVHLNLIPITLTRTFWAMQCVINNRAHSTRCRRRQRSCFLGYLLVSRLPTSGSLSHPGLRNSSSVTYFQQPPNSPTTANQNRKCTECGTTAFSRNQMAAKSDHLSKFGAETEAEIRSTSIAQSFLYWSLPNLQLQLGLGRLCENPIVR